jgi:hypothetical protein
MIGWNWVLYLGARIKCRVCMEMEEKEKVRKVWGTEFERRPRANADYGDQGSRRID